MTDRPDAGPVPLEALWFAVLGGPAAWTAHLLTSYPLVPLACRLGTTAPLNLLTAATGLIAAAAAGTGWWSYRRSLRGQQGGSGAASEGRTGFMGLGGCLLGLLFLFAILVQGLPPILQDPCIQGR